LDNRGGRTGSLANSSVAPDFLFEDFLAGMGRGVGRPVFLALAILELLVKCGFVGVGSAVSSLAGVAFVADSLAEDIIGELFADELGIVVRDESGVDMML
jgi:hypothetical protein